MERDFFPDTTDIHAVDLPAQAQRHLELQVLQQYRHMPAQNYLNICQNGAILPWMREMVVQFLSELADDFGIQNDTLALAVNYLDRFLSLQPLDKSRIQLLGLVCCLLACKFNQRSIPCLCDLSAASKNKYSVSDVKSMEMDVLGVLDWDIYAPTPHNFLQNLWIVLEFEDEQLLKYAEFFMDLSYYDYNIVTKYPPSVIAATSLQCAWEKMGDFRGQHIKQLCELCQHEMSTFMSCKELINAYMKHHISLSEDNCCVSSARDPPRDQESPTSTLESASYFASGADRGFVPVRTTGAGNCPDLEDVDQSIKRT